MESPHAHVVHALPRRVHVRAPALAGHPDAALRIAHELADDPRFERVSVRDRTGSVVIERGAGALDPDEVARAVSDRVAAEQDHDGRPLTAQPLEPPPGPTRVARALAHAVAEINADVGEALDHRADLGTLLPVAFAVGSISEIAVTGKLPGPTWFNLLWWSLRSFMTFNVGAVEAELRGDEGDSERVSAGDGPA